VPASPFSTSLEHVAATVAGAEVRGDASIVVTEAAYDSRQVPAGSLFFCVPGATLDGHEFAGDALRSGAVALVVERWLPEPVPQVRVPSVREAMGPMSAEIFGRPAQNLITVGITGTNGKTTCSYLLGSVFEAAGIRKGVIGTTGALIDKREVPLARTSPEAPDLHRLLARMREAGVRAAAIEVSSHALHQDRAGGLIFDVAMFTNLSREHLDYHGSMREYFEAKSRLFAPAHARAAVINADDPYGRRLLESPSIPSVSFGLETDAEVRGAEAHADDRGLSFRVGDLRVQSPLRGQFNVSNCLGVLAVARELGIADEASVAGIAALAEVPGRFEVIEEGQEFLLVVDYAHTPDSILSVLTAARALSSGRVIVVLGCGGDRDRDKRPEMGYAASIAAELTVLTSDNPRSEDPMAIIGEIETGVVRGDGEYVIEPDRRAAIALAVRRAGRGDVVVVAGKGHEAYQEVGGLALPFDDREVAREALRERRSVTGGAQ
jgi:UDP-N-acetylmuramoyl-L-alanyl-D-glutamate--2,6-diaminopimelate ligase